MLNKELLFILFTFFVAVTCFSQRNTKPNVLLIVTDDQGYGDFGFTGNPHVKTPTIDALAKKSVRFDNFYVSPVCSPTRASLMTGRYSLRTGIRDTYNGGSIMASNEVTIAELLKNANYTTGIFGKWHLGDNYPTRPSDQGFDESLIHLAGGMGQVGDVTNFFKGDKSYFNPTLWHNNNIQQYTGYCSDVFTDNAISFIDGNKNKPFFCYLSFNAPHTPLQVPVAYYNLYKDIDPSAGFQKDTRPFVEMSDKDKEAARKVYGMVTNIDDNIAKLLKKLKKLNILEETVIIFMTDNGPQQQRYSAGMRGLKSSVYQGGIRVPLLFRYPKILDTSKVVKTMAAHIDIVPTLLDVCNIEPPKELKIDGKSLLPLINNEPWQWKDRPLFFYWTRRYPELYNNMAIQKKNYKLVGLTDYDAKINDFQLFNLAKDPYEQHNIIVKEFPLASALKTDLDSMYKSLIDSENLINSPKIIIGSQYENPVILNRNDADGEHGVWKSEEVYGKWNVKIKKGYYNFKFKFIKPIKGNGRMVLETTGIIYQKKNKVALTDIIEMKNILLTDIDGQFIPYYDVKGKKIFPFSVEITKIIHSKLE
jgi:arylsulfatase